MRVSGTEEAALARSRPGQFLLSFAACNNTSLARAGGKLLAILMTGMLSLVCQFRPCRESLRELGGGGGVGRLARP